MEIPLPTTEQSPATFLVGEVLIHPLQSVPRDSNDKYLASMFVELTLEANEDL